MDEAKRELVDTFIGSYGDRLGDANALRQALMSLPTGKCAMMIAEYANKFDLEDAGQDLEGIGDGEW